MIAAVAGWSICPAPPAAYAASPAQAPRLLAARIEALIRDHAANTEIVTFAGKPVGSVRIIRGGPPVTARKPLRARALAPQPAGARVEIVSFGSPLEAPVTVLRGAPLETPAVAAATAEGIADFALFGAARGGELDRVAFAVDGAESSHGADPAMWRAERGGPQGPMQVSAAAALDSGGGDRFDLTENRVLGRAYLARLYRRYGDWPDTVAAYNWGPGNCDAWIAQGRPARGLPLGVERYRDRVLRDGGIPRPPGEALSAGGWRLRAP
jgi:hypothetical protein